MDYTKTSYIATLWSIQESLLQTYRTIFITVESIFVAISITIAIGIQQISTGNNISDLLQFFMLVTLAIGLYINTLWLKVASVRGLSVHFLQTLLRRCEHPERYPDKNDEKLEPFTRLRLFQDDKEYRENLMSENDFIGGDITRNTLGAKLPFYFYIYWLFLGMYTMLTAQKIAIMTESVLSIFGIALCLIALYFCLYLAYQMWLKKSKNQILDPIDPIKAIFGRK